MADSAPLDREGLVDQIRRLMPDPLREERQLDGSLVIVGGDPGEVVVSISGSKISVAEFCIGWEGPHTPVIRPKQVARLNWKRLPAARAMMLLNMLVEAVSENRRAQYRPCKRCGEIAPPEWMHGQDICHSCAERHLGVVH